MCDFRYLPVLGLSSSEDILDNSYTYLNPIFLILGKVEGSNQQEIMNISNEDKIMTKQQPKGLRKNAWDEDIIQSDILNDCKYEIQHLYYTVLRTVGFVWQRKVIMW